MVKGFQTLEDQDNIDEVETLGPFICTRSDAWLGHGYYLWDTNIQWAKDWGYHSYTKNDKEFIIASCMINIENCFDLFGSVAHQMELISAFEAFNESNKLKHNHRRILPNIIQYLKKKGIFEYKSIRACDNTNKIIKLHFSKNHEREEYMLINQRVQICVIERKDVILRPFTVIFPEKYIP